MNPDTAPDTPIAFGTPAPGEGAPPAAVSASFLHSVRLRYLGMRGLFEIYAVDGEAIRGEPSIGEDIDFTNWGEHYRFPFIPVHEIWIDEAALVAAPEDENVFIDAATFEWRLMAAGAKYEDVWKLVENYEAKERRKRLGPIDAKYGAPSEIPERLYLGTLGHLDDGTLVKLVHTKTVQDTYDDDFTEGGHWRVYKFIPGPKDGRPGEEWIGDDIFPQERPYLVIHETDEDYWMAHGLKYDPAHKKASELEWYGRHHPEQVAAILDQLGFRAELPQPGLVENPTDGVGRLDAWIQDIRWRHDVDAQMRHMFRLMLKQRRLAMGKGNRIKTRRLRSGAWLYPYSVERAYADRLSRWLTPLRRQVVAYLREHGEDLLRSDSAIAFPSDPTVFSPGPGTISRQPQLPRHPVSSSMIPVPVKTPGGGARPDPAEPGAPDFPPHYPRRHARTVAQFLEDIKRPYLQERFTFGSGVNPPSWKKSPWTPVLPISTEQPTRTTPPQEEGVEHYDRVPGAKVTRFVQTTQGWVAQMWPEDAEKAPAEIKMGLGQTADALMAANVKEWSKHTTRVLGLSFKNAAGDWWPDLRDRWADRNYDLIKNLARDYIGRINDHVERAVTNGWSYKDLTKDILGMGQGMTGARARLIARDQVGKLNGQLTQAQQTEVGIDVYEWDTAGDERVRGNPSGKYPDAIPSHYEMQRMLCKWSDPTVYSDDGGRTWKLRTSTMPDSTPGDDIQCFSGDTKVHSLVPAKKIFRYRYRGKAAMLVTDHGVLTATLNHPILVRARGWVSVESLEVGDELIATPEHRFRTVFVDDIEKTHPRFEDLFRLAGIVGLNEWAPGKATDFYGDGPVNEEIEVVSLEGELTDYIPGEDEQHFIELVFAGADMGLVEFSDSCDFFAMLLALGFSPDSGMSLLGKLLSLFGSQSTHPQYVRFRTISYLDSFLTKAKCDGMPGNSILLREFENALARLIRGDDSGIRKLFSIWRCVATTKGDKTGFIQSSAQTIFIDAERLGDVAQGRSGFPIGVRLLEKRITEFSDAHHVYTLETASGWYTVGKDSIIARNCRCTAIPFMGDLLRSVDNEIDGEPGPEREQEKPAPEIRSGEVPTSPIAAAAYLADVVGWKPQLLRFTKAAPGLANIGNSYVSEFPFMKDRIAYIGEQNQVAAKTGVRITKPMREFVYAWNADLPGGRSAVGINFRKWGTNPEKWEQPLLDNVIAGFHPQGTGTFKSVIDHELGHAIDNATGARSDAEMIRIYRSFSDSEISIGLSEYAAQKGIVEFIAEGWAEYRNNPHPRMIAKKIGERLVTLMKAKGEPK